MKLLIAALTLFASSTPNAMSGDPTGYAPANAPGNPSSWNAYHGADVFAWSDGDQQLHLVAGFALTYGMTEILVHTTKLTRLQAALISTVTSIAIGALKEGFEDFSSQTDQKTWAAGAVAGGLTAITIHF